MNGRSRVCTLLVEDNPADALLLREALTDVPQADFAMTHVQKLADALGCMAKEDFDVVILDLGLPDSQGLDTLVRLRRHQPEVPVVVLTGLDDEAVGLRAMQAGAQDYLAKGHLQPALLGRSLRYAIERHQSALALRQSEARLSGLIYSAMDAIITVDERQSIILLNPAAEKMFGVSAAEALGGSLDRFIPERFRVPHAEHVRVFGLSGVTSRKMCGQDTVVGLRADGTEFPAEVSISQISLGGETHFTAILRDVTERERAEIENLRLVTAIAQAAEGVLITDLAGAIQYVNPAFTKITGYGPDEAIGRNPRFLKSGKQDRQFYQRLWSTILEGRIWHGEIANRRRDGAIYTEEMTIAPVRQSSGVLTNFIAIKQDVTARKEAEEALFRSQRVLGQAEQLAHVGAWESQITDGGNPDERPLQWSDETYRIFGYNPGEVEASTPLFFQHVHPEDRTRLRAAFAQAIADGAPYQVEHRIRRSDGTERTVVEHAEVIFNKQGGPERAMGAVQDVTERKRAEEEIRQLNANLEQRVAERTAELEAAIRALESEAASRKLAEKAIQQLQQETELILRSAGEGIARVDVNGVCTFANPAASRLVGYSQDELMGQDLHILLHHTLPDGQPCAPEDCGIHDALTHGEMRQAENQIWHRKDGTVVPVDSVTTPIVEAGQVIGAVLIFRDVSARWAMEKMKDEFVSVVSHELRTPLTAIRGALGLLAGDRLAGRPDQARHLFDITVKNAERLTRLLNEILESQRLQANEVELQRKRCLASDLMTQATDLMRPMAERAGVNLDTTPQPAPLLVDPDAVLQVLTNLLSNAIKYSPAGSTIRLAVEQDHEVALFKVIDEGQGIPTKNLESIFERFHPVDATDSRRRGGTGLGLSISRKIVQRHGGRIWAESELGHGSTFTFTLPLEL